MDNTIDTLQIEIESSTTGGQRSITKLKNSLEKLAEMSEGISKISGEGVSKLKAMADGVEVEECRSILCAKQFRTSEITKLDFSLLLTKPKRLSDACRRTIRKQQVARKVRRCSPHRANADRVLLKSPAKKHSRLFSKTSAQRERQKQKLLLYRHR